MEQTLQRIWSKNHSKCLLKNDVTQAVLIVDRKAKQNFIKAIVGQSVYMRELGLAKAGYDIEENQSLIKNAKYKKISSDIVSTFQEHCDFSFLEKIQDLSMLNYQKARIVYGLLDRKFLFIDESFTENLSAVEVKELTVFIAEIQQQHDCLIIPILENPKYGKLFGRLFGFQHQSEQFLILK